MKQQTLNFPRISREAFDAQAQKAMERSLQESQAAKQRAAEAAAAAAGAAPPKPGPGRPPNIRTIPTKPVHQLKEERRPCRSANRRGPKANWWHPVLIKPILQAVKSHGSYR